MKTKIIRGMIVIAVVITTLFGSQAIAALLYQQPFDMTGNAYSSQNDPAGAGNFATVYDNFTLGANSNVNNVTWAGGFFNPVSHGNITAFTINFYADSGGMPGSILGNFNVGGNASEIFIGNFGFIDIYSYSLNLGSNFAALAGTQYWVSIVPDLVFPPQWAWSTGTGGDEISYQDFFGSRSQLGADLAFSLNGSTGVPDSGATVMLLGGALVVLGILRRLTTDKVLAS